MMNKYKITWYENYDGFHSEEHQIVEAETENEACAYWEKDVEPYLEGSTGGIDDCVLVIETPLFDKRILIDMPDGLTYMIPVEVIARNRAQYYALKENIPLEESLVEDTIPLMEVHPYEIKDWARNNMDWADVSKSAVALSKKAKKEDYQEAWLNNDMEIK